MVWSYAAGLGLRAAVPVRDTLQVFMTGLPVQGPIRFAKGLAEGVTPKGFAFAREQGALLGRHTIGDLYGDIFQEIDPGSSTDRLTTLANKLLSPSRWGHNIGRSIVFNGEYHSALDAVSAYREGAASWEDLMKQGNTSLWWTDKPFQDRIRGQLEDKGFTNEEIARNISTETLDLTLWPYRRGMQPAALRTGAGRIFGQFGMWPMNYLDFIKRGAFKVREHPGTALGAIASWAAVNYTGTAVMNKVLGADAGKWTWVSPAAIDMSPHARLIEDLAMGMKDNPDGRDARRRVLEYPLDFFPTSVEAGNIYRALEADEPFFDGDGHPSQSWLRVMGFTPLKDVPERDLEDWFLYQGGFTRTKDGSIGRTLQERERTPPQ